MSIFSGINNTLDRQTALHKSRVLDSSSPFFGPLLFHQDLVSRQSCENLVGQVALPVGVAGPVHCLLTTSGKTTHYCDLLIPLATTEGALVASINRGCKLLASLDQVSVTIENVGMTRAPVFECPNAQKARDLVAWITLRLAQLGKLGESTSHHLTYLSCQIFQKDSLVFTRFAFNTSEAMGMNMVTIACQAITDHILAQNPSVKCLAISSNLCTDKKASLLNRELGRARKLTLTCHLPNVMVESILKTPSADLYRTYHAKIVVGSKLAGLSGRNMQIANVACAILAATGQDIAHTVDISQGSLTIKKIKSGLSVKLYLPTVPVGTVGGGTYLSAQQTALRLISKAPVTSDLLATTIGLGCLAGELSGLAALCSNTLSSSHQRLGRL